MPVRPQGMWRLAASIAAALALAAALFFVFPNSAGAEPPTPNITFTAPTSAAVGATFDVVISGDSGDTPVNTYGAMITLPAGLSFVSGLHQATPTFPSFLEEPVPGHGPKGFGTGAGHGQDDAAFTPVAALEKFTLRCDVAGDHVLHLTTLDEDPLNGSAWYDANGTVDANLDEDKTVSCAAAPPTSTSTNTPTTTPTTTPTPTSTSTATPTPTFTPTATTTAALTGTLTATPTVVVLGQAGGTPSATPALMRASTTVEPSPQGTPAAAVKSQSSSPTDVTGLPKAGDGGTGPLLPWGSMTVTVIILLMGAGSWVLYYGLREATPGD